MQQQIIKRKKAIIIEIKKAIKCNGIIFCTKEKKYCLLHIDLKEYRKTIIYIAQTSPYRSLSEVIKPR